MGKFVDEEIARKAYEGGIQIGTTEPCRESKGSWWDVRYFDSKITACVMWDSGVSCGEEITESDLHLYVDDLERAKKLLKKD